MKRNGMCPLCFLKQLFTKPESVTNIYNTEPYSNGVALTPPMGWSSWNTFKNRIDEDLIYETAVIMKEKGLADAGYVYVNLDDNWHSSSRDDSGALQGDLSTFAHGIPALVEKINALGLKVGIYSSNGTETCEDLPATLYHERTDALTFARWGIEYFKYDFCHNIKVSGYAPLVYGISVSRKGEREETFYPCTDAKLYGYARIMTKSAVPGGKYVGGMDRNAGAMQYDNVIADEDGEYVLTLNVHKKGKTYKKAAMIIVNDTDDYFVELPPQKKWNVTARFQTVVRLKKGINKIRIFNPVRNRADSELLQYRNMGRQLVYAANKVAEDTGNPVKPIVFSLCEWGVGRPWQWGALAGNLWRTTPDIRPNWKWMMAIYERNVKLHEHAGVGHWNDPDMLEVGNGKLTYDENRAHFSVWCMMAAPLILGNDLRKMPDNVLEIVTNRNLIAVDQDPLGKQAKRVFRSLNADILAKPLADGSVAICFFNKFGGKRAMVYSLRSLTADPYVSLKSAQSYTLTDLWSNESYEATDNLRVELEPHSAKVFKVIPR